MEKNPTHNKTQHHRARHRTTNHSHIVNPQEQKANIQVFADEIKQQKAKKTALQRKQASFRKTQHGKLINEILKQGNYIKTEKLSYKSFQALYGKSVGLRAPGTFIELLKRKAENAGGGVEEINTYETKLSQTCQCGQLKKKPLSQRAYL